MNGDLLRVEVLEKIADLLPITTAPMGNIAREAAIFYILGKVADMAGQHESPTTTKILQGLNLLARQARGLA